MSRPKGSKNRAKSDEPSPSAGHNSELTEAEKAALLVQSIVKIEAIKVEQATLRTDMQNERKRLISYGFESWEIDYALKLRKNKESDEIDRRRREAQIARFLSHPIGTQPDLLDDLDRTPAVDRAYAEGKVAGAEGKTRTSPHSPGTEQDQSWLKGWHDGQGDLASGFKKLEPKDEAQAELEAA